MLLESEDGYRVEEGSEGGGFDSFGSASCMHSDAVLVPGGPVVRANNELRQSFQPMEAL